MCAPIACSASTYSRDQIHLAKMLRACQVRVGGLLQRLSRRRRRPTLSRRQFNLPQRRSRRCHSPSPNQEVPTALSDTFVCEYAGVRACLPSAHLHTPSFADVHGPRLLKVKGLGAWLPSPASSSSQIPRVRLKNNLYRDRWTDSAHSWLFSSPRSGSDSIRGTSARQIGSATSRVSSQSTVSATTTG